MAEARKPLLARCSSVLIPSQSPSRLGAVDLGFEHETLCIHQDMARTTLDLLATIEHAASQFRDGRLVSVAIVKKLLTPEFALERPSQNSVNAKFGVSLLCTVGCIGKEA
jgi:hypothetical protein